MADEKTKMIEKFGNDFDEIIDAVRNGTEARHVIGGFCAGLCPNLQFIRLDALDSCDYPHGLDNNSVFLCFEVDLAQKKVKLFTQGHIWLTDEDKATNPRYQYLAMKSMTQTHVDLGGKKFRQCGYKDAKDLSGKINGYFNAVMKSVVKHSGEYPYGKTG